MRWLNMEEGHLQLNDDHILSCFFNSRANQQGGFVVNIHLFGGKVHGCRRPSSLRNIQQLHGADRQENPHFANSVLRHETKPYLRRQGFTTAWVNPQLTPSKWRAISSVGDTMNFENVCRQFMCCTGCIQTPRFILKFIGVSWLWSAIVNFTIDWLSYYFRKLSQFIKFLSLLADTKTSNVDFGRVHFGASMSKWEFRCCFLNLTNRVCGQTKGFTAKAIDRFMKPVFLRFTPCDRTTHVVCWWSV